MIYLPWLHRLLDRLLPCPCLLCGSDLDAHSHARLCHHCAQALPQLDEHRCHCCSLPLPGNAYVCGQCLGERASFTTSLIPYRYAYPLDGLIHRFKYRQQLSAGQCLGELLLAHVQERIGDNPGLRPDLLVPVPLHWRRRWQRGFNQSAVIATQLGAQLHLPITTICQRRQHTHSQQGLNRRERLRNLRQAFHLNPKQLATIQGKHLALVDDVVTTSATARCLSDLLIKAGAARVDVWALARTPSPGDEPGV